MIESFLNDIQSQTVVQALIAAIINHTNDYDAVEGENRCGINPCHRLSNNPKKLCLHTLLHREKNRHFSHFCTQQLPLTRSEEHQMEAGSPSLEAPGIYTRLRSNQSKTTKVDQLRDITKIKNTY